MVRPTSCSANAAGDSLLNEGEPPNSKSKSLKSAMLCLSILSRVTLVAFVGGFDPFAKRRFELLGRGHRGSQVQNALTV